MSNVDFTTLNTAEGFKAFLREYHAMLHQARSFPPLGLQKALHTAAPIFGYNSWHVMAAALGGGIQAAPEHTDGDHDGHMSDAELDALAQHYGFKFTDVGEGLWDWKSLDGDIESDLVWITKQEAWEGLCDTQGIDSRSLAGIAAAQRPAPQTAQEPIHVVTVTVTTKATDHETIESVDTTVVRSWDAAKEYVADRVRAKVTYNDRSMDEVLEDCRNITLPDEDERDALLEDDDVLEWLIAHNDIDELCTLLSFLDYDLTTVNTGETWI